MNKLIISLVMFLLIVAPVTVLAVGETTTSGVQNEIKEMQEMKTGVKQEIKNLKPDIKVELKEQKVNTAATLKEQKANAAATLKEQKANAAATLKEQKANTAATLKEQKANTVAELKAAVEQRREAFKSSVEQKRVEFEKMKEAKIEEVKGRVEATRTQLRERLEKIKDERKKAIVEKIDNQLSELNKRQMVHFSNVLGQLDKVLGRIGDRAGKAEINERNVVAVRVAIDDAVKAIVAARDAVVIQSGGIYPIIVTTEDKLRVDVGKARQTLRADLGKVMEKVKAAREAVRKAAVTLAQIPGVDKLENPSVEGTATPVDTNEPATSTEPTVPEANQ